jgi:Zn-dependent alcohol dehydrogenase
MVITWRETLSYETRMGVTEGASLLVFGSGGNGLAYVNHAANLGASPVAMVGAADREGLARRAGATHYFNYKDQNLGESVLDACEERFDFVLDAVGKIGAADLGLTLLKPGGTLGIYGLHDFGQCTITPLRSKGTFTFYNGGYDEAETHERVMAFIGAGKLDASIWLDLDNTYPLERINDAFDVVRDRKMVKALIRLQG